MRPSIRAGAAVALALVIASCEFDLDVGAAWEINHPRVIGLRMEVVELAPIWPNRVGFASDPAPIAEALPGDRVRMVPLVVDGEGREQDPSTIDALWFQCGLEKDCAVDVPPCDSLAWTTDSACELGRGPGFEFTVPALGPAGLESGSISVLGIIAREPGADAQRCRAGLLAGTRELYECTIVTAQVLIGPPWVLRFEAVDAGLAVDLSLYEIPYAALLQPANRAPAPGPLRLFDADTELPLEGSPPRVHPGQRVRSAGPSWRPEDRQLYAAAKLGDDGLHTFIGHFERLGAHYFASGPIRITEVDGNKHEFVVDEDAGAGVIRIVVVVGDLRKPEDRNGAVSMFVEEIEVVP
jgi:hypothetical protein